MARLRRELPAYLLIAPAVVATVVFLFVPMVVSGFWSLTDYNGVRSPTWVGLDNYVDLAGNTRFQHAFINTIAFVLMGMAVGPILGLASALLLNNAIHLRSMFRTAFFLPVMTSLVVVAMIWRILLNERGLLNAGLSLVGLHGADWLNDPATALPAIAAASIWQGFGFETVVFLAALQAVRRDLTDAAKVDGAGRWAVFWNVTLPSLRPTILFVYVIGIIGSFQVFDQIYVMTNGGPGYATEMLSSFIYKQGLRYFNIGGAASASWMFLLVIVVIPVVMIRLRARIGRVE